MKIKNCPICGSPPVRKKFDLRKSNGRGYQGCIAVEYECEICNVPNAESGDTVYSNNLERENNAKKNWNKEVQRLQRFLNMKKEEKI